MKRLTFLFIPIAMILLLASCNSNVETVKVAMLVSDENMFEDNPFYGGAWDGITNYCEKNNISYDMYTAEYRSKEQLRSLLNDAINKGAELVVLPGYFFQELALEAQDEYPDTNFILLDSTPNNGLSGDEYKTEVKSNMVSVMFKEEQAGFLAGYSAVIEGYRELGFLGGMSVPTVIKFGHGYVQGAEYAAKQLKLKKDSINLRYVYAGSFVPSPEIQARADYWYLKGTEVIFSCGGSIGTSVKQAAESSGKYMIGVDVDQSSLSETVITSAIKQVDVATENILAQFFEGTFPGGEILYYGAEEKSITLEMTNSRFKNFTKDQYKEILEVLATNENNIASNIYKEDVELEDLPLTYVKLKIETMK